MSGILNFFSFKFVFLFLIIISALGFFIYWNKFRCPHIDLKNIEGKTNIVPVAIIGSGPAGLSSALYTSRGGFHTVVFSGSEIGGQVTKTLYVENWPASEKVNGTEIMKVVRGQAEKFGAVVANDTVNKVDFSCWPFKLETDLGDKIEALSVIIATGGIMKKLGIPGEQEYLGKGVAVCGICDAALFKDKEAVVVGGGDAAVQEAMLLAVHAKKVTLVVSKESMSATKCMQERLQEHKNIEIIYNSMVTEILGDGTIVTGVKIKNKKDNKSTDYKVDGVFIGIGQIPNTEIFKSHIACNKKGYIKLSGRTQNTSINGIFAGGTVSEKKWTQAAVSSGDAIKAALSAMDFLAENNITDIFLKNIEDKFYKPKEIVKD